MTATNQESIVFYLDLATKILGKKDMVKSIQSFLEEKLKKNPDTSFSAFYFKEGNEPFLSEEVSNIKELTKIINNDWKTREQSESNFENGLFYCLSFLASKAAISSGSFRVICISDLPSKKGSEYAEALMALVETVRTFPTFIDIIRVGKSEMYPDDVKLRIVSTLTSGGLFYASDSKEFKLTFVGLAKNKTLPDLRVEGGQEIDQDKKTYYENLAKALVQGQIGKEKCSLCSKKTCDYCNEKDDIYKCSQCGTFYHECCAALYSWKFNMGLKHIFRCITCGAILKLEESLVYEINGETMPDQEELPTIEEESDEEKWTPEAEPEEIIEEPVVEPEDASVSESVASEEQKPSEDNSDSKVEMRPGLFGPRPVPKRRSGSKPTEMESTETKPKETEPAKPKASKAEKAISARKSLAERRRKNRSGNGTIRICRVCSTRLKPNDRRCPKCGSPAY
ncbi:hypothetical protein [Candidatus Lokiarchaeum ossiferum]|uniref:hypothetical protein n=1 Tax=Candidatus Lokiarchaeum ossiferum TaxID=2951803 RepID=UPI00352CE3BA